jgi:hypothetical protein
MPSHFVLKMEKAMRCLVWLQFLVFLAEAYVDVSITKVGYSYAVDLIVTGTPFRSIVRRIPFAIFILIPSI